MDELLTQFAAGLAANILTALVIFALVERHVRAKDERTRTLEAAALRRATLLQLFPPMMQRIVDSQRDAFAAALPTSMITIPVRHRVQVIASDLRHLANVHVDTVTTLASLGVDSERMMLHAEFTNIIGHPAIRLHRGEDSDVALRMLLSGSLAMAEPLSEDALGRGHCERIGVLMRDIPATREQLDALSLTQREVLLRTLCEVVGHNSNLLLEHINVAFEHELLGLRSSAIV